MYWRLRVLPAAEDAPARGADQGRFVLHEHRDGGGAHLDLRLEQDGYLCGWRVDGVSLGEEAWAMEKGPHPVRWLEQDGAAKRVDSGTYRWDARDADGGVLELRGRDGVTRLSVSREALLPVSCVRAVKAAMDHHGVDGVTAAALMRDGAEARWRALARLCGLGRELDGEAFEEAAVRRMLAGASLAELNDHLRGYESRFDAKYPPGPVSRPEALEDDGDEAGAERALAILRG